MKAAIKVISIIILVFLALGAIFGGYALISDPSGANFEWTTDLLNNTPFSNFLIPGIILAVVNGLLSIFHCISTF